MSRRHTPAATGLAAAEVVMRRMPVLWWGILNPSASAQAEMTRMVVEKQMAMIEACAAMQVEMVRMMMAPFSAGSAERMMQAALAPAARRVKANVRRLRRG
jgi:hypothetical protein